MLESGFHRSVKDACVYFKRLGNDCWVYLLLYVDDMLIASKGGMCCMQTKQAMDKSAFACLKPFLETDEPFLTDVPDSFLKGATPI